MTRRVRLPLALLFAMHTLLAQTTLEITSRPLHTQVQRFGINLSGQTFYDSGQMLRNLVSRNPGFEGEHWQSLVRCAAVTARTCIIDDAYSTWPANFLSQATYEVLSSGATGKVTSTSIAHQPEGPTLTLTPPAKALARGDFLLLQLDKPGNPTAGWWTDGKGNARLAAEEHDLSPHTSGHQALRVQAALDGQSATVSSYFDSLAGHSFVQLHGVYRLTFRAKPLIAGATLRVSLKRLSPANEDLFERSIALQPGWQDYSFAININEPAASIGTVALSFFIAHTSILLDDVTLLAPHAADNPTVFRDEVVDALRALHPGTLRYMDNGASFGSTLDNLLAPQLARERSGASTRATTADDIAIGLPEFLALCDAVHTDPWITLPPGLSPREAQRLMDYLRPWSKRFATIHLELGNEQWNAGSFAGATIHDPAAYGHRSAQVFAAMRSSPGFERGRFDLVIGGWYANAWWSQQELAAAAQVPNGRPDTLALAPYLFATFNDASSSEAVFGPMLAEPEQLDAAPGSLLAQHAAAAQQHQTALAIYETNLGTMSGSANQRAVDMAVPSLGAGLAVATHMLLMLREHGIAAQNLFALPEFQNNFANPANPHETMPLWGAVVDMGGATRRRRPTFLALQLINGALLPTELVTHLSGDNPTWHQPKSANDSVQFEQAHELQAFAFADGKRRSLIVLNLGRERALSLQLTGAEAPSGTVRAATLTAAQISDSNEDRELVRAVTVHYSNPMVLAPHSITVLTWMRP